MMMQDDQAVDARNSVVGVQNSLAGVRNSVV